GNIGEAVGDWRNNGKHYERIQGIVIDTRYLMYHYSGKPMKEKAALANCIETVLGREQLATVKPVIYDMSTAQMMMAAEDEVLFDSKDKK
ncbi:MAG: hypothetical protein RR413_11165, partial [Christensenellaceae bacterium]